MKAKTYEFSKKGLQQAIDERKEMKERNLAIVGLCMSVSFGLFLTVYNPISTFTSVSFKPF